MRPVITFCGEEVCWHSHDGDQHTDMCRMKGQKQQWRNDDTKVILSSASIRRKSSWAKANTHLGQEVLSREMLLMTSALSVRTMTHCWSTSPLRGKPDVQRVMEGSGVLASPQVMAKKVRLSVQLSGQWSLWSFTTLTWVWSWSF